MSKPISQQYAEALHAISRAGHDIADAISAHHDASMLALVQEDPAPRPLPTQLELAAALAQQYGDYDGLDAAGPTVRQNYLSDATSILTLLRGETHPALEPEPEWKPDQVAVATVRGVEDVRVMRTNGIRGGDHIWLTAAHIAGYRWHLDDHVTDVRPLVVVDPERARDLVRDHFNDDRSRTLLDALLDGETR